MQDENVRLGGRVPVVPRSDPGGYFVHVRGSPFVDKEADEREFVRGGFHYERPVTCTPECGLPNVVVPKTATFTSKVRNQST